jgi:hypothetical protein
MYNRLAVIFFLVFLCSGTYFRPVQVKSLFNGIDLEGWDTYLGPLYDTIKEEFDGEPIGLNHDPNDVFTVVREDGKPAIRISGQNFGGISTRDEYSNYHLRVEFKWGSVKWHPKRKSKRDSGLLYHAVGSHGVDGGFWMRSQEFQVQEGDCGDYWGCGGAFASIPAARNASNKFVYAPGQPLSLFRDKGPNGRNCIKRGDAEKPSGEWNTLDLYCYGDTSVHVVNGSVVMALYELRQPDKNSDLPLRKGKIQIQSEGAEVFFRNLEIEPIASISANLLR